MDEQAGWPAASLGCQAMATRNSRNSFQLGFSIVQSFQETGTLESAWAAWVFSSACLRGGCSRPKPPWLRGAERVRAWSKRSLKEVRSSVTSV